MEQIVIEISSSICEDDIPLAKMPKADSLEGLRLRQSDAKSRQQARLAALKAQRGK